MTPYEQMLHDSGKEEISVRTQQGEAAISHYQWMGWKKETGQKKQCRREPQANQYDLLCAALGDCGKEEPPFLQEECC